eukprot:358262-Chlamydomonas_euryale.AAC.21
MQCAGVVMTSKNEATRPASWKAVVAYGISAYVGHEGSYKEAPRRGATRPVHCQEVCLQAGSRRVRTHAVDPGE